MKPHCPDFRPSATASWLCAWWCLTAKVEPFCLADVETCETRGLRFTVKVGQEDDGDWQDAIDLGPTP